MNLNQMVMESLAKMESEGKVQEKKSLKKHVESTCK